MMFFKYIYTFKNYKNINFLDDFMKKNLYIFVIKV